MYLESTIQSNVHSNGEHYNDELRSFLDRQEKTKRLEALLLGNTACLDVSDFAVVQPGHDPPDRLSETYRLVPLEMVPAYKNWRRTQECILPEGVESNSGVPGGTPYVDTRLGLGLVYNDVLGAVGGAEISHLTGGLIIKQLQGVNTADPRAKSRYQGSVRGGLMTGLGWRDTLVRVWEQVARQLEVPEVEIQSAANNPYRNKIPVERLTQGYDAVAGRLAYTHNPETNNFHKDLAKILHSL